MRKGIKKSIMKEKIVSFCWQHLLLLFSLFVMTVGVAVCVRSQLGSSVISVLPYVFETAGSQGLVPELTIGQYVMSTDWPGSSMAAIDVRESLW
jgi:hypothetical protein